VSTPTISIALAAIAAYATFLLLQSGPILARNALLLVVSYAICFVWDPGALWYLLASTLVTYAGAIGIERYSSQGKTIGWVALLAHVLLIAFWKAAPSILAATPSLRWIVPTYTPGLTTSIAVPLGLSFYCFQSIGYLFDVLHSKQRAETNLLHFALFQAFFPKLASGPIERAQHLLPQLRSPLAVQRADILEGAFLIVWGSVKKFSIAFTAGLVADAFFANPYLLGAANIIGIAAFAVQLYADFSGYTDIARGTARMLGIRLTQNFRRPFAAAAPDDFWKRWHISLSEWVRDYLYIPLGGNRRGVVRAGLNTLLAMIIVGCWHGITPMYVLWGVFHGLLTIAHRVWKQYFRLQKFVAIPCFFCINLFGWMLFRSPDLENFTMMLQELAFPPATVMPIAYAAPLVLLAAAPLLAVEWWQSRVQEDALVQESSWLALAAFAVLAFYALLLGSATQVTPFIYSNF